MICLYIPLVYSVQCTVFQTPVPYCRLMTRANVTRPDRGPDLTNSGTKRLPCKFNLTTCVLRKQIETLFVLVKINWKQPVLRIRFLLRT